MVMELVSSDTCLIKNESKWVSEGLETVSLSFVHNINDLGKISNYTPAFVYQHFGENETIFGYEELKVTINYTDLSLFIYPEIKYKAIFKEENGLKADDIYTLLQNQLPTDHMNMMVETKPEFQNHLLKQKAFRPFGELIDKYESNKKNFEVYKVSENSPDFELYLARVQTLALWFIEAANFTDNSDEQWLHYFIYESCPSGDGDGKTFLKFAGYSSLYLYYAYPEKRRPRVAHMLLLPQYRQGNGARFLQCIYRDLWATPRIMDITVEDPADSFIYLRDYVDCVNCLGLTEFSPQHLKKGFSDDMRVAALEKFKISRKQARRVYEILRFRATNKKNEEELKAYRIDVKKRLHSPMKKSEKDWKRLNKALPREELLQAAASEIDEKQKLANLQTMYDQTIEGYQKTVDRIEQYPSIY